MAADHYVSRRRQVRASNAAIRCCPSGALHSHQSALTAVSHRNIHILIATKKYWDWFNSWFGKLSCALRLMEDLTTRAGLVSNNCWRNIFELPDGICFTKSLRAIPATSSEIISQSRFRQFARMFSISISLLLLIPPSLHLFSFSLSLSFFFPLVYLADELVTALGVENIPPPNRPGPFFHRFFFVHSVLAVGLTILSVVGIIARRNKRFILNEWELVREAELMGIEAHLLPLEHMTIYEQFKAFRFAFLCLILFLPPPPFF